MILLKCGVIETRDFSRATPGVFSYIIILFSLLWILDLTKNFILRLNVIYKLLKKFAIICIDFVD